jgi:hypothetical protein
MSEANKAVLLGADRGVAVAAVGEGFDVAFDYDRELVRRMQEVEGAKFNTTEGVWNVPLASEEALLKAVTGMRYENEAISHDKAQMMILASKTAVERQTQNGAAELVDPKVSDYIKAGTSYSGEIINVNGRFAAQLTGFGKENGAAFVVIHRLANLRDPVFKGDNARIKYNDKGLGEVGDRNKEKSADEISREFDETLGQRIDGVTVAATNGKFIVSFPFNQTMRQRLERVDKVEFKSEDKVFEVPAVNREYLVRAVSDMRNEFVADQKERAVLTQQAALKVDGPSVRDAFTKDDFSHSGQVMSVSDRYVLQHGGKDDFKLHRRDSLDLTPAVGENVKISYNKGRGTVDSKSQEQSKEAAGVPSLPNLGDVEQKAQALLESGKAPSTGLFIGKITGIDKERGLVYQSMGRGASEVHLAKSLSRVPEVGEVATIKFNKGVGAVADRQQENTKSIARS